MRLFKLFSHKKNSVNDVKKEETINEENKKAVKRPARLNSPTDRVNYIKDQCDSIIDSGKQIDEAKIEYQAVTSYLTDMQKIDMIPLEQRGALEEAAGKIVKLTNERGMLQQKNGKLSEKQYRMLEQYEMTLSKELTEIKEAEEYQTVIDDDISKLEKERKKLDNDQKDIINKQSFLKGIAITISIIVIFLFTLFAMLSSSSYANFTAPFIMTVIMGMAAAYYIFMEARKNQTDIQIVQAKQNRQIMLMNKVKIKSVNNQNFLEYTYNKYMVENYEQLKLLWDEYLKMKEEARKYQKNTDELELYNRELITELKKFGVSDAEVWIFQASAILDGKEMVEVRHRLNVRRQKLRERIDINIRQKEEFLTEIMKIMKNYPDCRDEAEKLLRRYRIEVEE